MEDKSIRAGEFTRPLVWSEGSVGESSHTGALDRQQTEVVSGEYQDLSEAYEQSSVEGEDAGYNKESTGDVVGNDTRGNEGNGRSVQEISTCCFTATRYGGGEQFGDSIDYNGRSLGCPGSEFPAGQWGDKLYHSAESRILAVAPTRYTEFPCGTGATICNPKNGVCLSVVRVDACPGCGEYHVDLSEKGLAILCGVEYPVICDRLDGLTIERENK